MHRIVYCILIVGLFICSACTVKSEQQKKMEAELRLFKEKAILLPNNMEAANCDEQRLPDTTLLHRSLKMLIYVSKSGCTNCKLRALLPIYMFILENKHLKDFGVVIVLKTEDREATESVLKDLRFRQTVFYDLDGSFERLNPQLPMDEEFHTLLLDKENKVVLIGSPAHNEELNKLYLEELNKLTN